MVKALVPLTFSKRIDAPETVRVEPLTVKVSRTALVPIAAARRKRIGVPLAGRVAVAVVQLQDRRVSRAKRPAAWRAKLSAVAKQSPIGISQSRLGRCRG